jgi:hypothetical protein
MVRDQTKEDQMSWACGTYGGEEIGIRDFVVIPKDKRPIGRPGQRWEKSIEIYLQAARALTGLIWLGIWASRCSVVNTVMKLRVPYNGKNFN